MKLLIGRSDKDFAEIGAQYIAKFIRGNPQSLLCLAAGDTPLGMYKRLVELQHQGEVDLNSVYYVGLDEWVGIGYETKGSCMQVMMDGFYGPAQIRPENMRVFNGLAENMEEECAQVEQWVADHGGIGMTLLGIGMNGHVGFNEPYTDPQKSIVLHDLDNVTEQVGKKYFDGKSCPTQGVTIGIRLLSGAKQVCLVASGAKKAPILRKSLMEDPTVAVPASLMQLHEQLTVIMDQEAFRAL